MYCISFASCWLDNNPATCIFIYIILIIILIKGLLYNYYQVYTIVIFKNIIFLCDSCCVQDNLYCSTTPSPASLNARETPPTPSFIPPNTLDTIRTCWSRLCFFNISSNTLPGCPTSPSSLNDSIICWFELLERRSA